MTPSDYHEDGATKFRVLLDETASTGVAPYKDYHGAGYRDLSVRYLARYFPDLGMLYVMATWEASGIRLKKPGPSPEHPLPATLEEIPFKRHFQAPITVGDATRLVVALQPQWIAAFQAEFAEQVEGFMTPAERDAKVEAEGAARRAERKKSTL